MAAAFSGVMLPQEAVAQFFYNGNQLQQTCTSQMWAEQGHCLGYVVGFYEGYFFGVLAINGQHQPTNQLRPDFCNDDRVTSGQLKDIALKFLNDHPEKRQLPAVVLLKDAFAEAFPCPTQRNSP